MNYTEMYFESRYIVMVIACSLTLLCVVGYFLVSAVKALISKIRRKR